MFPVMGLQANNTGKKGIWGRHFIRWLLLFQKGWMI